MTKLTENEEILFDLNKTFLLENIQQTDQVCRIRLSIVNDRMKIAKEYIDNVRRQTENSSIRVVFGKLILDMCQWNQSERYFPIFNK